jgi:hypothetical protein
MFMFALAKPLCRLILAPAILLCCLGLPGIESFSPASAHAAPGANKSVVAKKGKKKGKKGKKKGKKAKKATAQAALR